MALGLFLLMTCPANAAPDADWSAGVASIKTTPSKPVPLAGYAARVKPFETVDQDIYAKALVLKDQQGNRAILVTIDLCIMPADMGQVVRKRIAETTHIPMSAILLNVAHSHSAPDVSLDESPGASTSPYHAATVEYSKWLCDRLVEVGEQAATHMQPAKLSWGTGMASFVVNRREFTDKGVSLGDNPHGMVDRSVPVLRVDGGMESRSPFSLATPATTRRCRPTALQSAPTMKDSHVNISRSNSLVLRRCSSPAVRVMPIHIIAIISN